MKAALWKGLTLNPEPLKNFSISKAKKKIKFVLSDIKAIRKRRPFF
jgi:hypothetical protein